MEKQFSDIRKKTENSELVHFLVDLHDLNSIFVGFDKDKNQVHASIPFRRYLTIYVSTICYLFFLT